MQLGLSMWSYAAAHRRGQMDIPGFVREARRLGVDGVELLDFFWRDQTAERGAVEAALRETGLPVGVYSVANNFVRPDEAARAAEVRKITAGVDSALHFGASVVRVFAGDLTPDWTDDRCFGWIVAGLAEAAAYAESRGVTLALENHGKLAGRSDQVRAIMDAVPALRANPDTGNFLLVGQSPAQAVEDLAARAAMVHFKDFRAVPADHPGFAYAGADGQKFAGTAIGEGDVDLPACVAALRRGGFGGWLNIEYEGEEDPFAAVARSVDYTRRRLKTA